MKVFLTCLLFLFSGPLWSSSTYAEPSTSFVLVKVIIALAFIVVLIVATAWFARRSGLIRLVNDEKFKVLASLPLGQREKAVLIKLGNEYLLLGVASGNVTKIHQCRDGENPLNSTENIDNTESDELSTDFASQIKKYLIQGKVK